jgi:hypothetical protein
MRGAPGTREDTGNRRARERPGIVAGEWLKFDCSLPDKPETLAITVAMGWDDPDLTVGKLMRLFRWFDAHTLDGNARGVTAALLDRLIGATGFVSAVTNVGWMVEIEGGLALRNFDRHNGATAKRRAQTAKRVANHRDRTSGPSNAATVTPALAREEKRREEERNPPTPLPGGAFDGFWKLWPANPRKVAKDQCRRKWATKGCEAISERVMSALTAAIASEAWVKNDGEFIPAPLVWLNQSRWEAPAGPDPPAVKASAEVAKTKELLDSYVQTPEQRAASEKARQLAMSALKERRIQ